jgi:hypothetical protein
VEELTPVTVVPDAPRTPAPSTPVPLADEIADILAGRKRQVVRDRVPDQAGQEHSE